MRVADDVWIVWSVTCSESSPRPVSQLGDDLDRTRRLLDPGLVRIVEEYQGDSLRAYVQAEFARNAFWGQLRQCFERYDCCCSRPRCQRLRLRFCAIRPGGAGPG
jgi:hypothetical protein